MKRKLICRILAVMCGLSIFPVAVNAETDYFGSIEISPNSGYAVVDDRQDKIEIEPFWNSGSIYVSVGDFVPYFDAELSFDGRDFCITQGALKAYGNIDSNVIRMHYERNPLLDTQIYMSSKCCIYEGHICMPVRVLTEGIFAGDVLWNAQKNSVAIMRVYQSKRLLFTADESFVMPPVIPYKEIKSNTKKIRTIQFEPDTPDFIVKIYEEYISAQIPGVTAVDPDVIITNH